MSWFDDRPWTAQYPERIAEVDPAPHRTTLELLADAVAAAHDSPTTKVWPREVEYVRYRHPAVREAAVVGVPDHNRGETVAPFVSLRPGASAAPDEPVAYCREHLAAHTAQRTVSIRNELSKTTSGKILRRELRGATSA